MKNLILQKNLTNSEVEIVRQAMAKIKTLLSSLEFFYQNTDATFKSIPVTNDVVQNGYVLDASALLPIVDDSFDIACLIYDASKMTPPPTNPASISIKEGNTIPFAIPKHFYNGYVDVLVQFFLHELCHAEFYRDNLPDLTHNFHTSSYSQKQPTEYYVSLLKNLIIEDKKTATIYHYEDTGKQTLGRLSATNGTNIFNCDTLELSWKNNAKNISSIPKGLYNVKWTFSPKFLKYTYEIQNVENRTGIRLHIANYFKELNGCIALGLGLVDSNKDGQLDLLQSKQTVNAFNNFMEKKDFVLNIID